MAQVFDSNTNLDKKVNWVPDGQRHPVEPPKLREYLRISHYTYTQTNTVYSYRFEIEVDKDTVGEYTFTHITGEFVQRGVLGGGAHILEWNSGAGRGDMTITKVDFKAQKVDRIE